MSSGSMSGTGLRGPSIGASSLRFCGEVVEALLASIILMLARDHVGEADELNRTALKLMARGR